MAKNFLNGRKQRVVINGKASEWTNVLSGIPQGSILGPVLFIIFIDDLPGVVGSVCKLFADDCKLYKNIESEADLKELQKGTSRQRSGKGAIRKRFPLQKPRWEKNQTNNQVLIP